MTPTSQPGETFAPRWAARASDAPRRGGMGGPAAAISFAYGFPDPALFPTAALTEMTELVLREESAKALQYGNARGAAPLLQVVRDKLRRDEGLDLALENCMI